MWLRHERAFGEILLERAEHLRLEPEYVHRLRILLRPLTVLPSAPALTVISLGRFAVTVDGHEIDASRWNRPRLQMLFKRLLSTPDHSVHRDVLIEMLWPEISSEMGRNNLKNAVYRLRRILEPNLAPGRDSRFLVAEGARYYPPPMPVPSP